ncbi:hypothetical protein BHE74_00028812 [Ensete ventricosum]|nr:hypothetical protein BHE74_00028812 [Ensete ventricosum]
MANQARWVKPDPCPKQPRWAVSSNSLESYWSAHKECGREQDEREVGYSLRLEKTQSGTPTRKRSHKVRFTMVKTYLDILEASLEELYQGQRRLLGVESSQEEDESQIDKVETLVDRLTEDTEDSVQYLHEVGVELTSKELTRRFTEGIMKLAGNTPGDHRKKTVRLAARMLEAAGLAGIPAAELPVSGGCTTVAQDFGRLSVAKPPRLALVWSFSIICSSLFLCADWKFDFVDMNLLGMKWAFVGQNTRPGSSQPPWGPTVEASATRGAEPIGTAPLMGVTCGAESSVEKIKVLVSKKVPRKDAPPVTAPKKATPSEAPREEESSKCRTRPCLGLGP